MEFGLVLGELWRVEVVGQYDWLNWGSRRYGEGEEVGRKGKKFCFGGLGVWVVFREEKGEWWKMLM